MEFEQLKDNLLSNPKTTRAAYILAAVFALGMGLEGSGGPLVVWGSVVMSVAVFVATLLLAIFANDPADDAKPSA